MADTTQKKDSPYVAQQQKELALEMAGGDYKKVLGVLMDGSPVNRKAMVLLEEEFPT